jgi:hypothetical protein
MASLSRALLTLVAVLGLLAGCGGSDSDSDTSGGGSGTTSAPTSTPSTDTGSTDTTAAATLPNATLFTDPAGVYSIQASTEWKEGSASPKLWNVGDRIGGAQPNVNVVTEQIPEDSDISLKQYIEVSLSNIKRAIPDAAVESQEFVDLADGSKGARLSYTGTAGTSQQLKFLQYVAYDEKNAAIVTFTGPVDGFEPLAADVEPYMKTLSLIGD